MLGDAQRARKVLLGPCVVAEKSVRRRPGSRQKAGSRGATNGHLAIRPQEGDTVLSQLIDVRRDHLLVAIASKLRPQIIHSEEQHVGLCSGGGEQ